MALARPAPAAVIAAWNFDEGSGATAYAAVGSVDGALNGTASFVGGGVQGGAVSISSSGNGMVDFGSSLFPSGSFAVEAWVKTTSSVGGAVAFHRAGIAAGYLLAFGDIADGCGGGAGQANFYVAYPCSGHSATAVNDDAWHQLVGVYDGAMSQIYVDGALASQSTGGNPLIAPPVGTIMAAGGIMNALGSPVGAYDGLLDNVRLYGAALSAAEVSALYSAVTEQPTQAPEPASLAVLVAGVLGLAGLRRKS